MKRLVLPALLALAATGSGCMRSRAALINPTEETGKCELVQVLMREHVPQQLLAGLAVDGHDGPAQVLVFVRRPEQAMLERLFAATSPSAAAPTTRWCRRSHGRRWCSTSSRGAAATSTTRSARPRTSCRWAARPRARWRKDDGGAWVDVQPLRHRRRALLLAEQVLAAIGDELHRDGREDEPHHALEDGHAGLPSTRCTRPAARSTK